MESIPDPSDRRLKELSDAELLEETDRLVKHETLTMTAILHHLREIDDRKLYAEKNCDSLFTYCTQILRYSESQAYRRITAARLLREIPELDRKIQDGRLTLTNIAQAQSFFLYESRSGRPVTTERKTEILSRLEDKSTRDAERILVAEYPGERPLRRESIRVITDDAIELKLIVDTELLRKLTRVKVLAGHKIPHGSWAEVINLMCDDVLARTDPLEKAKRAAARQESTIESKPGVKTAVSTKITTSTLTEKTSTIAELPNLHYTREAVPAATRHQVWLRDNGRCTHVDPHTGKRCGSDLRVEIDHICPVATGGGNEISNLRLLCRAHNQRRNVIAGWPIPSLASNSKPP